MSDSLAELRPYCWRAWRVAGRRSRGHGQDVGPGQAWEGAKRVQRSLSVFYAALGHYLRALALDQPERTGGGPAGWSRDHLARHPPYGLRGLRQGRLLEQLGRQEEAIRAYGA